MRQEIIAIILATGIQAVILSDAEAQLRNVFVPGLSNNDAEIFTLEISGSAINPHIRLPRGLRLATTDPELELKIKLISGMQNSKLGKLVVYEVLSQSWNNEFALPLFCIGTLPSCENVQGKITEELWVDLRSQCHDYMDTNSTTFRQQLISYGLPDPDIILKDMLSPVENSVIIAGLFASPDPQNQPSLLVARKAVFVDSSILVFEVAVDADGDNAFETLFYSIYTTDAR